MKAFIEEVCGVNFGASCARKKKEIEGYEERGAARCRQGRDKEQVACSLLLEGGGPNQTKTRDQPTTFNLPLEEAGSWLGTFLQSSPPLSPYTPAHVFFFLGVI
jgi:hypothetical protein